MEGAAKALGTPGDAPAVALPRALPEYRKQAIVGADEAPAIALHDDGVACRADAWVNHGKENGARRKLACERGEKVRRGLDAEIRGVVQRVDERQARRTRGEHCPDLPYVEVARTEVGEENDQAALAACFSSPFFFFSSPACEGCASPRSISETRASGALSPLRKPIFRMRR
jgi:hypothetical protein